MANRTGGWLRVLLVVAVVVMIATAQDDEAPPTSIAGLPPTEGGSLAPSPESSTNIPGGPLAACPGRVIFTQAVAAGERGQLTLQVFFTEDHGGRSCATATKTGTARQRSGELTLTLQLHNYDGRRWPRYAVQVAEPTATRSDAVYLDDTAGRCVRAWARFDPGDGPPATVSSGKTCN